ncbi:hypothetical protein QBC40DRAFT_285270 [Triangularia verruculosa]|uniref:3'-5' exonuclease domain-containing protein n=1 Tax=Triangularia verruculosa TaxID=2587418 RepID=A0AAN6XH09_9PEZI|nr:hypothetical protein QBC40DRAFT_285270 [Triangularia verruculosa]
MTPPPTSSLPAPKVSLVDNITALGNFLASIGASKKLYLDLRGTKLSTHGSVDILTIAAPPAQKVRVIDVKTLGAKAFTTPSKTNNGNSNKVTLKSILEDPSIRKYLWDARNSAHALKSSHNIAVSGVVDIQLLENLTRPKNSLYVADLDSPIQEDLQLNPQRNINWANTKMQTSLLTPGPPTVFSARPLTPTTLQHSVSHAWYLHLLQDSYEKRPAYKGEWLGHLEKASASRARKGRSPGYKPADSGHRFGPWGASPGYLFANGRMLGRDSHPTVSPKAKSQPLQVVLVGTGGQTALRCLGSRLMSRFVSLMRRAVP